MNEIQDQLDVIFDNTTKQLQKLEEKSGLQYPKEPSEELKQVEFPEDITKLSMNQVAKLLSQYTQLNAYADVLISSLDSNLSMVNNQIEVIEARAFLDAQGTVKDKEKYAVLQTETLLNTKVELKTAIGYVKALSSGYQGYINAISRFITMKTKEIENHSLNAKYEC